MFDEASFNRLRDYVAGNAVARTAKIIADVVRILQAARARPRAAWTSCTVPR